MYLRFCGAQFKTVQSNNHACPSNSSCLPFLIPPPLPPTTESSPQSSLSSSSLSSSPAPVPASKLAQWARDHGQRSKHSVNGKDEDEVDFERGDVQAFLELLENEVHDAVLYTTHMHPPNLHNLTTPLYAPVVNTASLIHPFLSSQLRASALTHLKRRHPGTVDRDTIFADADAALEALSKLLGTDTWFFNGKAPGLLDAAVFAYLHVILTGGWEEDWAGGLRKGVQMRENLVSFWERVDQWWQFVVNK
ncbi:hypothetical protein L211DRAFT_203980 [Terfezia boudieri ATCC MYA-4762]|uniref:Metaxin glutathione S-transferase domain-containing protein n=1 Tax=Terfezia boudieri ATCC MYA-4762 TaxID=1051890 RepID=A0A3N4LTU1_9PEZI|nr:hypothetical protein L211DRAFT_203980 [Terfezia boudieri ATCC MYA-4762]